MKSANNLTKAAGWILAGLITILTAIPVIFLSSTGVPAWLSTLIQIVGAGLLVGLLRAPFKPAVKQVALGSSVLVIGAVAVALSQAMAFTPPILNAGGEPVAGSIATLERVTLNGSDQWISIRGHDVTNPVILFLAGGPGGSQLATARFALSDLEENFVVVNWEQPGAGKSFYAVDRDTLTPERYIEDAHALIEHLRERFDHEKVYVLGESWGSALGIMLAQKYPEDLHALIGTGQMVAFLENDLICYNFALDLARERGDTKKVERLTQQGPPPYYGSDVAWKQVAYLTDGFAYMNADPAIANNGFNTFRDLAAPEYGFIDKISWFRGVIDTLGVVYPQLWDIDFRQQATSLDVPVYFLIGRHDVNAPVSLTESYFDILEAPHKELIWFERSGHNPWVSESEQFVQAVVNIDATGSAKTYAGQTRR